MDDKDDKYVDMMYKLDPTLIYTTTNQPGRCYETEHNVGIAYHCACTENCAKTCPCIMNNGVQYSPEGLLLSYSEKPAFECNFQCNCVPHCFNSITSKGPNQHLEVKETQGKNNGLFATCNISRGNFICEYAGEIISEQEARARFKLYKSRNMPNYIFWLKESRNDEEKQIVTIIDPTVIGNIGRYINHSCEPNCQLIPIRSECIYPKLCIFAQNNIENGEEITFDYGGSQADMQDVNNLILCQCKSTKCKIYLPYHGDC